MILVTGVKGQLGSRIANYLKINHIPFVGADKEQFDITNCDETLSFITHLKPDSIIHCSAYSNVEMAEEDIDLCMKTNVDGVENVAMACKKIEAKLLFTSSDYVFDGTKSTPYDPNDNMNPLSVYGQSKALGEKKVEQLLNKYFIVRISWLFGENGNNFVETMLRLGKINSKLTVVNDQIGSPTYTNDLVPLLVDMIRSDKYGIYHATNEGFCSRAEFAHEIMKRANLKCEIVPVNSDEYQTKALRPRNSRLNKEGLVLNGFETLPSWQEALYRYLLDRRDRRDKQCN